MAAIHGYSKINSWQDTMCYCEGKKLYLFLKRSIIQFDCHKISNESFEKVFIELCNHKIQYVSSSDLVNGAHSFHS